MLMEIVNNVAINVILVKTKTLVVLNVPKTESTSQIVTVQPDFMKTDKKNVHLVDIDVKLAQIVNITV